MKGRRLGDLAAEFGLELRGDPDILIQGLCALSPGSADCLAYLGSPKHAGELAKTQAAAVVLHPKQAADFSRDALVAADPNLAFARIARLFDPDRLFAEGVSAQASVAESATLGSGCHVAAQAFIGERSQIGEGCYIGPGCVIGDDVVIGARTRLVAQVHVGHRVHLGSDCVVQAGAVIGSRGFGNVKGPDGWEEIPQLGSVVIGDNVEIGANTCIDRGTLGDTVIGRGVRLDNLIQIAHNCQIGEHTAIAACVGVAGSTRIGARCMIGGQAGFNGHLHIGDDVVVLGSAMVTKSLPDAGIYGSGIPVEDAREWRKMVARVRRLKGTEARIAALESHFNALSDKIGRAHV